MQPIVLIILVGLVGGMAIGVQSPMSSIISQKLGMLESVFIIHIGGALAALIPLLTLGIPTSNTTAVLLGAFQNYGLNPGPQLRTKKCEAPRPELVRKTCLDHRR